MTLSTVPPVAPPDPVPATIEGENMEDAKQQSAVHMESLAFDQREARKIRRKIDLRLLPMLMALYAMAFLDRVNVGNARLWGLERDLGMVGNQFNISVLVFYVPYILLGIPANYVLTRVNPRYWIAGMVLSWGLCVCFVGFSKDFVSFTAVRVLLGIFEAGMFPACLYLINSWYTRYEVATRMAWFMVSNDVGGIAAGLLGAGLGSLDGTGGYSGWSWIFFVEGIMTVAVAIVSLFVIPDFPEKSNMLEPAEKEWLLRRLAADHSVAEAGNNKMTVKGIFKALADWKVLLIGLMYLAACNTAYSVAVFTPTILRTFGWSSLKSNLLSVPLRVLSGIVLVIVGITTDKLRLRGPFLITGFLVSIAGNFIVALSHVSGVRYFGLYLTAVGILGIQPIIIAWGLGQVSSVDKRATMTAFASSVGQLGGIISALAFPKSDGPQYVPGVMVNIAFNFAAVICGTILSTYSVWENKQRAMGKRDHLRELPQEEQDKLGEKHPDFRFTP